MNSRTTVMVLVGAAAGAVLARMLLAARSRADTKETHKVNTDAGHDRVAHLVEKTLHKHEGEVSAIVAAFEEALEQESALA